MDTNEPIRQLIRAGVPREHAEAEARRHLESLRALAPGVEVREEAIRSSEAFVAALAAARVAPRRGR